MLAALTAQESRRAKPIKGFPSMRVHYIQRLDRIQIVRILHGKHDVENMLSHASLDEE